MVVTCLWLGLLLGTAIPCLSQDVTVFPINGPTVTVPSISFELMAGLFLTCGLQPETLIPNVNYATRWILPRGEIVDSMSPGRFVVSESPVPTNGSTLPGTVLAILQLSYQDAGTYTCEGRSTVPEPSPLWASASFELQLNLELFSNMSTVNATMNDSMVALECEMRAYIRPDSSLIWEGPGDQRIAGGTGKHHITFSDGSPGTAANGTGVLVPSRVSTLVISNPEPSDTGTYTCRVLGVTNAAVAIDLLVDGLRGIEDPDIISTTRSDAQTESTTASSSNNSIFPVIGAVLGTIAVIVLIIAGILAVAVCGVIRAQNRSRKVYVSNKDTGIPQPVYDYIDLAEHKDDHDQRVDHRYSGPSNQVNWNDGDDYDEIKDNAEIYDEIRDTRERDDDTYDSIKIIITAGTKCGERIDSEKSGVYDVPIGGHGPLDHAENDALGVNRDAIEADTAARNKLMADGGGMCKSEDNDYDYADIDIDIPQ